MTAIPPPPNTTVQWFDKWTIPAVQCPRVHVVYNLLYILIEMLKKGESSDNLSCQNSPGNLTFPQYSSVWHLSAAHVSSKTSLLTVHP